MARYSKVISSAVEAALKARDGENVFDAQNDLTAETWFAMYQAQCRATDEFKRLADAKSDPVLNARVAELESELETMNLRYIRLQQELDGIRRSG